MSDPQRPATVVVSLGVALAGLIVIAAVFGLDKLLTGF